MAKNRPLGKWILVKNDMTPPKTSSGLPLSPGQMQQMMTQKAVVETPGADVDGIKNGDVLHYQKARSFKIVLPSGEWTVIREQDIVVVE